VAGDTPNGALGEILALYWYPLYAWARRRGLSYEDASDGVQGFLAKVCSQNLMDRPEESRGRLRSWLLTCFSNYLDTGYRSSMAEKRGGGAPHFQIDWVGAEALYAAEPALCHDPEALYARAWAISLMEEAVLRLAAYYERSNRTALFEALLPALEHPLQDQTYAEVGVALHMSPDAVRQAACRMRERYRRELLDLAASRLGITSEKVLEAELQRLLRGGG
jgi:RNA polymerase sigma-70 factor (ECF subfamily)